MKDFSQLIEQKAHTFGGDAMLWMAALAQGESLVDSGVLSSDFFSEILDAVEDVNAFSGWVALIGEHAREFPRQPNGAELFMACVEQSPFALKAWLEAVGYLCDWACERKSALTLEEALAYLQQCEAQALQQMPIGTLYHTVVETLDLYGLEEL